MSDSTVNIAHYARVATRGWAWILLGLLLGIVAAASFLAVNPPMYTATTSVNVSVISVAPFSSQRSASGLLDPQTEASIATSYVVALAAAKELNGPTTAAQIRSTVTARPVADATILRISSAAADPDDARRQTDVVAEQYLKYRQSEAEARREAILQTIEVSLAELAAEYDKATSSAQRSLIEAEADRLRSRRSDISDIDTSGGSILDPAIANPAVASPSPSLVLLSGALAGAVGGTLLAFVAQAVARRVRRVDQVVDALGTGNVTELRLRAPGHSMSTVAFRGIRQVRDRALVTARSELDRPVGVATIIHLASDPAGSAVLNLAMVMARRLRTARIILVGMSVSGRAALIESIALRPAADGAMHPPRLPDVEIRALLESDDPTEPDPVMTREVVALFRDNQRATVLVVPRSSTEAARRAANVRSDLAIVVLERRFTERGQLRRVREDLATVGAKVDGAVVLSFDRSRGASAPTRDPGAVPGPSGPPVGTPEPRAAQSGDRDLVADDQSR